MPHEFLKRVDGLLAQALEEAPADRLPFVARVAAEDPPLRERVEQLLAAEARLGDFLEPAEAIPASAIESDLPAGTRLSAYTVLSLLDRGGMGAVYLAERSDQQYQQRVAIKTLRRDLVSPQAVERFRRERQVLARLEHPGIARLYDGGSLADGRPYLVLEFVEGLPIDRHCDQHRLGVEARLRLFLRVAESVDWAHRNLLAHRDLKPGNILVTRDGRPKLLDFGIAKLLDAAADESPAIAPTATDLLPMTPAYASPEQIRREPVGTTSDVYSLGVLLYELLTGRSPYGEASARPDLLVHAICHDEPQRPSAVIATAEASKNRATTPRLLSRALAGDLDNIVFQALRKEPERRYGSAAELARDIERHLARQPVSARPDTLAYRSRQFVARHTVGVALGGAALAALGVAVVVLFLQAGALRQERDKATAALSFLVGAFDSADPYQVAGATLTPRQLLDRGAERLREEPPSEPIVEAALLDTIGRAYLGLGLPEPATPLLERSVELTRQAYGENHLEMGRALIGRAQLEQRRGDYPRAEATARRAIAIEQGLRTRPPGELAAALNALGSILGDQARYEEARGQHEQALALLLAERPADSTRVAATLASIAGCERELGRFAEASAAYRQALERERAAVGPDHPRVARLESEYGLVLLDQGEAAAGEEVLRRALETQRRVLRPLHPDATVTLNNLALALQHLGRWAESEAAYREVVGLQRRHAGISPTILARAQNNLASVLISQGKNAEAIVALKEGLTLNRQGLGEVHDQVAFNLMQLARASWRPGDDQAALAYEHEALSVLERLWKGEDHPTLAFPLSDLGRMLVDGGRPAEGEAHLRRALALHEKFRPPGHWEIAYAKSAVGNALLAQNRWSDAEPLLLAGYDGLIAQPDFTPDDPRTKKAKQRLARLYAAWGKKDLAAKYGDAPAPNGVAKSPS